MELRIAGERLGQSYVLQRTKKKNAFRYELKVVLLLHILLHNTTCNCLDGDRCVGDLNNYRRTNSNYTRQSVVFYASVTKKKN